MIRIMKENEYCWGIYDCCYRNSKKMLTAIDIDTFGIKTTIYDLNDIIKIEKQVKDLTSDEIYKFFIAAYGNDLNYIEICEDRIVVNIFDYGEKTYIEYFYDDYVDITDMIKRA